MKAETKHKVIEAYLKIKQAIHLLEEARNEEQGGTDDLSAINAENIEDCRKTLLSSEESIADIVTEE